MSKLRIGDLVRHVRGNEAINSEKECFKVTNVHPKRGHISIGGSGDKNYLASDFEVFVPDKDSKYYGVLSPSEVIEHTLNGTKLECRIVESDNWLDAPENYELRMSELIVWDFRVKPETVTINGVEVPAPLRTLPESGVIYQIKPHRNIVSSLYVEEVTPEDIFWGSKEDALAVEMAMTRPLREYLKNEG